MVDTFLNRMGLESLQNFEIKHGKYHCLILQLNELEETLDPSPLTAERAGLTSTLFLELQCFRVL